jgi:hypothetical protein
MKPLVHSPNGVAAARARLEADRKPAFTARFNRLVADNVGVVMDSIRGPFGGVIAASADIGAPLPRRPRRIRSNLRVTIGVWNLEAWLGDLATLLDALNSTQSVFVFYPVEAVVPAGLISRPERIIPWYIAATGEDLNEDEKAEVTDNLIAEDYFGLADRVRSDLGLDYIVGITASMVAGEDDGYYYWNHFSTCQARTVLVSSYDMQEFSSETGQPIEAFLANIIVPQFLVAFAPDLGFHPDNGCLFDYDASRTSLKEKVKEPTIEPDCLALIEPPYRDAALGLVQSLRNLRRTAP